MRRILLTLSLILSLALPVQAASVTPTKRMWWTSARQTRRDALMNSNHVSWQQIVVDSDTTPNTGKTSNEDARTADTIRYQMTGTAQYCDEAESTWDNALKGNAVPDSSRNFTREHFMEYAWGYAWLKDCIDSTEQANWITSMNYWVDLVLNVAPGVAWGTSISDVDELIGHYFGAITWALASADENATKSAAILSNSLIGGLTPTGANKSTWRNAIKFYATISSNGSGFESSQYDLGTLQLLLMGTDAVNTLKNDGTDYFPEVTALADDYAKWAMSLTTPNRVDIFKYGSVELTNARSNLSTRLKPFSNITMELMGSNSFRQYVNDFQAQFTNSGECTVTQCYNWRGFLFGDPQSTSTDYRTGMSQGTSDTTHGYVAYHDDWTNNSGSAFYETCPNTTQIVGHTEGYFCTWDLYRDGAWVVTHIVGYDGTTSGNVPDNKTRYFNTMRLGGLSYAKQVRKMWGTQFASDFAYSVASMGASKYSDEVTNAPNRYLHEWTRSMVYLPSTDQSSDTILLVDRVNADDPTTVLNNDNYKQSSSCPSSGNCDQTAVDSGALRKIWALHAPVSPTISGNTVSWTNTSPDPDVTVKLDIFRPTETTRTVTSNLESGSSTSESNGPGQYRILVSETPNAKWSVFANAVTVYPTTAPTVTLITDVDEQSGEVCGNGTDEAIGFRVTRTSHNDYDVIFNAKQACDIPNTDTVGTIQWGKSCSGTSESTCTSGVDFDAIVNQNRLRTVGYTYTSPAGSASTRKFLIADLDPDLSWTYQVDSGSATACTVTEANPVCTFTASGSGAHTIVIAASGSQAGDTTDPTVSITNPTNGATVTGAIQFTANASDNVGVIGVQFKLDGSNLGAEDTAAPYAIQWNTDATANGSHSLTAVARDAAGRSATSSTVTVTVSNAPPSSLVSVIATTGSGEYQNGTLAVGELLYSDRTYTVSGLPTTLSNLDYIRTANNDRLNSDVNYLTLSLVSDATLFVILANEPSVPSWIDSTWYLRPETVDTTDNDGDLRKVYSKAYKTGNVILGGKNYPPNSAGIQSNYFLAAAPIFVEITVPANLATVSGASVTLTADPGSTASIAGIQFTVDGNNQGSEDTSSPYTITWDSTAVGNGTHTIGAKLRETDNALYPSQTVSVTVSNSQADVTGPVISSINSGTPGQTSATITWTTDEGASGYVEYGLTTSYGSQTALNPALNTSHSHSLTGLAAGPEGGAGVTYHYRLHSTDQAGNETITSDQTFTTAAVPDGTAPILSAITAGANTTTTATITWTSDESSNSQAEVRTSAGAIVGTATHTDATNVTSHSLSITSLTAATTYYYAVRSTDASSNNSAWSTTATFTTPAASDVTAPTVSNVTATVVDSENVTITYDSDEVCNTEIRYGIDTTYTDENSPATNSSNVLAHSLTLTSLSAATTYHYQVRCTDPSSNVSSYSTDATFSTPADTLPTTSTTPDAAKFFNVLIGGGEVG